jgi:sugar/nucleoside kinase (ribokinase family)
LTALGAVAALTSAYVPAALLARARHVHASSYFLLERSLGAGLAGVFAAARAAGATTSLDTNWDPAGRWAGVAELLRLVDVFFPNTAELAGIGLAPTDLAAAGTTVVVKEGAAGARAWWPGGGACAVAARPVDVVDTTGAGDSFDAGFLAGYLAGEPVPRCVAMGVAAGSLSTRAAGGTAAQPTMTELLAALDAVPA